MDKENVTHAHTYTHIHTMEYYSAINQKEKLSYPTTWMNFQDFMLSEINQSQKDNY